MSIFCQTSNYIEYQNIHLLHGYLQKTLGISPNLFIFPMESDISLQLEDDEEANMDLETDEEEMMVRELVKRRLVTDVSTINSSSSDRAI